MVVFFYTQALAQQGKENDVVRMVKIPDSIKVRLAYAELKKNKLKNSFDSSYLAMYVYNVTDPENYQFGEGLYTYRVMGPHHQRKLFIYSNNKLYIFRNVYIDDVVREYLVFLEQNKIDAHLRIKYLEAIAVYLREEYEVDHE
jgi:hypothetical protein